MKYPSLLPVVLMLLSAGCSHQPRNQESFPTHDSLSSPILAPTGWQTLFDGQSLKGWKIYKNRPNNTWEVVDGTLHCKPLVEGIKGAGDERSDLMTVETYGDFELVFDFKYAKETNSGIMFRVSEELDQPYHTGPEYQILDDAGYPGKVQDWQLTGACFGLYATGTKKLNPSGEWNKGKIIAKGNHVEHWLNGDKILSYDINSPDWVQHRNSSKWKEFPRFSQEKQGHIDLQDHGSEVWFRNILIRNL